MRRISVVIVDRANYGRLLPMMRAIHEHPHLELNVIAGGSFVLDRFGKPWEMLLEDGFSHIDLHTVFHEVEGNRPLTMAMSAGYGMCGYAQAIAKANPDIVVLIGDRYEALSAATAAHLMNCCTVHLQGGEFTGHVDDANRHAITQLATYHVPATEKAKAVLMAMGVPDDAIIGCGCPSTDLAIGIEDESPQEYLVCIYHPSSDDERQGQTMEAVLRVVNQTCKQTYVFWPNIDAGSDPIAKAIRRHQDVFTALKNMHPLLYLRILANAACLVGNSSSFVREAGFWRVPALMIGHRQDGREHAGNVIQVERLEDLPDMIAQYAGKRIGGASPYWRRLISREIAERLAEIPTGRKKRRYHADWRIDEAAYQPRGGGHP